MKRKALAKYLKIALGVAAVTAILLFSMVVPDIAKQIIEMRPKYAYLYTPCMILMWVSAVPVSICFYKAWRIFSEIGKGRSYSYLNARRLKNISQLILMDVILWAACLVVLIFVKMLHPAMFLMLMTLFFICAIAGIITSALSHLIYKYCNEHGEQTGDENN